MQVEVYLYAHLRDRAANARLGEPLFLDLPTGSTGRELLRTLHITPEEAALFLVNGLQKDPEVTLEEGDRIAIFPPVGGG